MLSNGGEGGCFKCMRYSSSDVRAFTALCVLLTVHVCDQNKWWWWWCMVMCYSCRLTFITRKTRFTNCLSPASHATLSRRWVRTNRSPSVLHSFDSRLQQLRKLATLCFSCCRIFAPRSVEINVLLISGGSENFEKGAEDNLSAPSSFIANAHNDLLHEKAAFWEKNWANRGRRPPHRFPPFEFATELMPNNVSFNKTVYWHRVGSINFEGAVCSVSAPLSSFKANAHNELHAFGAEKATFWKYF